MEHVHLKVEVILGARVATGKVTWHPWGESRNATERPLVALVTDGPAELSEELLEHLGAALAAREGWSPDPSTLF